MRYSDAKDVQWSDFESINQRFESKGYNYVIGEINLGKLQQEEWQFNNDISLILRGIVKNIEPGQVAFVEVEEKKLAEA